MASTRSDATSTAPDFSKSTASDRCSIENSRGLVREVRAVDRGPPSGPHRAGVEVRSAAAFATHAGVAPIEVASGERARHRLSRSGDRRLNSALHLVAVTQVRMRNSVGRRYFDRKIAEGKTRNEAMRCLKRRIAAHVWPLMIADERLRRHDVDEPFVAA